MDQEIIDIIKDELSKGLESEDIKEILKEAGYDENEINAALLKVEEHKNTSELKELNKKTIKRVAISMIVIIAAGLFFFSNIFSPNDSENQAIGLAQQYGQTQANNTMEEVSYARITILPRNITNSSKDDGEKKFIPSILDSNPTTNVVAGEEDYLRKHSDIQVKEFEQNNYIKYDKIGLVTQIYCNNSENYIEFNFTNIKDEPLNIYRGDVYHPKNEVRIVFNGNNAIATYCDGKDTIEVNESVICVLRGIKIRDAQGFDQNGVNRLLIETKLLNDNTEFRCA